ncbi:suppressor of cytokine signaling 7 [Plakobranchus ocellatus]|uniref:Suppressor of cytokine signaling 7 n=1 Tax=Plakobranchus ocellatus TaxID=259542 RepID=A0AAV4C176_9GAST|nr:suppressor of cytokine signaling 7 [Plakobranchus ocellatus]
MENKKDEDGLKSRLGRKFSKRSSSRTPEAPKPKPAASRSATLPPNMDAGAVGIQQGSSAGIFSKLKRRLRLGSSKGKYDLKTSASPGKPHWMRRRSDESQLRRSRESVEDDTEQTSTLGKPSSAKTPRKTKTDKEEVILIRKDKRVSVICKAENGDAEVIFSNVENSDEDSSSAWGGLEEDPYATISSVRDENKHSAKTLSKANSPSKSSQSSAYSTGASSRQNACSTPSKTPDSPDEYPYARIDSSKKRFKSQQQQGSLGEKDPNTQGRTRIRSQSEPDYESLDDVQQRKSELVNLAASPSSQCHSPCTNIATNSLSTGEDMNTSENSLDDLDPDYETLEEVKLKQRVMSVHQLPQNLPPSEESLDSSHNGNAYASLNRPKSYTCPKGNIEAKSATSTSSLDRLKSSQVEKPKSTGALSHLSSTSASSTSLAPLAPLAAGVDTSLPNDAEEHHQPDVRVVKEEAQEECLYDNPNVILRKQQQHNSLLLSNSSPHQSLILGEPLATSALHHQHHIKTPAEEELVEKLSSLLAPPLPLRNYQKDEVYQTTGSVLKKGGGERNCASSSARHSWSSHSSRNAMSEFLDVAAGGGSSLSPLSQQRRRGRSSDVDGRRHSTHSARGYSWSGGALSPKTKPKSNKQESKESLSSDKGSCHSQENEKIFFTFAEISQQSCHAPGDDSTKENTTKLLEADTVRSGNESHVSPGFSMAASTEHMQVNSSLATEVNKSLRSNKESSPQPGAAHLNDLQTCHSETRSEEVIGAYKTCITESIARVESTSRPDLPMNQLVNEGERNNMDMDHLDNEKLPSNIFGSTSCNLTGEQLTSFPEMNYKTETEGKLISSAQLVGINRNSSEVVCEKSPTIVYFPHLSETSLHSSASVNSPVVTSCVADDGPVPSSDSLCPGKDAELRMFCGELAAEIVGEAVNFCQTRAHQHDRDTGGCSGAHQNLQGQHNFSTQVSVNSEEKRAKLDPEDDRSVSVPSFPSMESAKTTAGNEMPTSECKYDPEKTVLSCHNAADGASGTSTDNRNLNPESGHSSETTEQFKSQGARPKVMPLKFPTSCQSKPSSKKKKMDVDKQQKAVILDAKSNVDGEPQKGESQMLTRKCKGEADLRDDKLSPSSSDVDFCDLLPAREETPRTVSSRESQGSAQIVQPDFRLGEDRIRLRLDPGLRVQETVYIDSDSEKQEEKKNCRGRSSATAMQKSFFIQLEKDFGINRVLRPLVYANPRLLENTISGKFKFDPSLEKDYLYNGIFKWGRFYPYLSKSDKSLVYQKLKRYLHAKRNEFIPGVRPRNEELQHIQQQADEMQSRIDRKLMETKDLPTFHDVRLHLLKTDKIDGWEPELINGRGQEDDEGHDVSLEEIEVDVNDVELQNVTSIAAIPGTLQPIESQGMERNLQSNNFSTEQCNADRLCVHRRRPSPCNNFQSENTCLEKHVEEEMVTTSQSSFPFAVSVNPMESVLEDFLKLCDRHLMCRRCEDADESDSEDEQRALDVYVRTVGPRYSRALHGELAYTAHTRPERHCCETTTSSSAEVYASGLCHGGACHLSWQDWSNMDILFRKLVPHSSPRLDFQFLLKTYAELKYFVLKGRKRNIQRKGCYAKAFPWQNRNRNGQQQENEQQSQDPESDISTGCCRAEELVFLKLIRDELCHFGRMMEMSQGACALFVEERDIGHSLLLLLRTVLRNIHKMKHRVLLARPRTWHGNRAHHASSSHHFHLSNFLRFRADSMSDSLRSWMTPEDYSPDPNILVSGRTVIAHTDSRSLELAGMLGVAEPQPLQEGEDFVESMQQLQAKEWYWGPISYEQAAVILQDKEDGSFLVRDSSDHKYLLSLSFKSLGEIHHTRIEHAKGLFSFWSQPESHGKARICEFIDRSVQNSRDGRFLYFLRPSARGVPPLPIRLLTPVSRNFRVASLKHLSRFVVRQAVRKDHLDYLPVPEKVKRYLKEKQYYAEIPDDDQWPFGGDFSKS